ncbi:MAG: PD40 domain-containing protein [Ignavibacteriae bacterium]|nr:PD40 domain-containing protein [Ignavibacteriota bacterium]MCB9214753.1 PD40 domain-containing protein [Ignavibacteria bacterium]
MKGKLHTTLFAAFAALLLGVSLTPLVAQPPDGGHTGGGGEENMEEFIIRNLGQVVNTPDLEYAPTITADGKTLYFVSNRNAPGSVGGHDFWVSTKDNRLDTIFTSPVNLGAPVNTTLNEGVASISADGQVIYFTACNREDGLGDCDIYEAELDGTEWINVRNLREINSSDWDSQPSISSDGKTLYFISNRPGAMGGSDDADIYISRLQSDGRWSEPVNMGAPINTKKREDSPFIFPGGKVLYFASAGHGGFGKLDFFVCRMQDDGTWSQPENLGKPFNTSEDERFITLPAAGDVVYFASERKDVGNEGTLDIYMGLLPPRTVTVLIAGRIYDVCTDGNLPGELSFTNTTTGEVVHTAKTNSSTGEYSFVMDVDQDEAFTIAVAGNVPGYGDIETKIDVPASREYREIRRDFPLGETPELAWTAPQSDYIASLPASAPAKYRNFKGLVIEEILVKEIYPLLTYVFFDSASATIPNRYKLFKSPDQTRGFTDTTIPGGTLQKYYHVLNIIGFRMREYPNTKITLGGFNSTGPRAPEGQAGEDLAISEKRREVVFKYLTEIWQIDPSRIQLVPINRDPKNGFPPERSTPTDPLGLIENRRAEIRSEDWEIMRPIFVKEIRRFHSPESMTFQMKNGIADQLVARREIEIRRKGDNDWHTMKNIGTTDPTSPEYNWYKNADPELGVANDETPYTAQMVVYSQDGRECRSNEVEIPVTIITNEVKRSERLIDKTIDRYSLVLFKFDSNEEGPLNARILKTYVYDDIRQGAQIKVTGYTDVVGLEDRNLKLSQARAGTVDKGIKKNVSSSKIGSLTTEGVGETQPLFSNDLPEGRFYNRTVQIVIETPTGGS